MTPSDVVLPLIVRCVHSHQVWDEIHKYIFAHTNTKSHQLGSELKSITKAYIIQYRTTLRPIIEAEPMLLSHEAKLERAKKSILTEPLSINVALV
uniref:Uncharacterized protein n=1 Tax=Pisum sativum TaxID=3888 RepID=A0A9D4YF79_PEA|nr:hypothetical protein KIW84_024289 [Pisum sativum]